MSFAGCTVVTRNYLAYARLVGRSWTDHHPHSTFTIVVVDHEGMAAPTWTHRDIRVVGPAEVGVSAETLRHWTAIYSPSELACVLKPNAMRHLLAQVDVAVYVDGDVEVLDPMDDLEDLALARGVVLSPHNLEPLPADGLLPDRFTMLLAGMFNGGLLAVGRDGAAFLDWWEQQLRRDGIHEPHEGLHGDQRWLDFVPTSFSHHILRDPTYNVAYWNLHERPTEWDGETLRVDGRRVRCFHYSGLAEGTPWNLSQFMGDRPRVVLRDHPAVARLCRGYLERARAAGIEADRALGYRFAAAAEGTPVDRRSRRLWRDALLAHEADPSGATPLPPHPFDPDGGRAWVAWLRSPASAELPLGRYLHRVWLESPDLQRTHPDLTDPVHRARYARWVLEHGVAAAEVPVSVLPDPQETDMDDAPGPQGRPRRKPRLPDIRSQQPVEALETARESLAEAPRETVAGRGARKVVSKVMAGRDERHDAVAKGLADAIEELAARVAELGDRINRVNDELPETADRADDAVASAQELASAQQELIERLERLDLQVETESDRVDGALEQDVITGTILADAEARLTAEVADLQLRIDKLADDPPDLDLADDEHADPGSAAEPDRGADRRSRKASRRSG